MGRIQYGSASKGQRIPEIIKIVKSTALPKTAAENIWGANEDSNIPWVSPWKVKIKF